MNTMRLAIVAAALSSAALWSCNNNEKAQPESAASAQQQAPQQAQPAQQAPQAGSPQAMPPGGPGMMQQMRAGCPMIVQGADVAVADTDNGVALTFTTQAGDEEALRDLRQRVQHMAQMYEMHRGRGHMMWHRMGRGRAGMAQRGGMGPMGGPMPAARATVTDIDRGARLELTPADPAELQALREHARWHQQRMQSGECWMVQNPPATPPQEQE